jgi:hypothetical protein
LLTELSRVASVRSYSNPVVRKDLVGQGGSQRAQNTKKCIMDTFGPDILADVSILLEVHTGYVSTNGHLKFHFCAFLTSGLNRAEWLISRSGRFTFCLKSPWYLLHRRLHGPQNHSKCVGD